MLLRTYLITKANDKW